MKKPMFNQSAKLWDEVSESVNSIVMPDAWIAINTIIWVSVSDSIWNSVRNAVRHYVWNHEFK